MPKLTWQEGGQERSVDVGDSCSIGRVEGNTIVLPDETGCSRKHCQIINLGKAFELSDLGSTNGTRVNGKPVKRHKLAHGDRIRIGETELAWADPSSAAADDEIQIEDEISLEEPAARPGGVPQAGSDCYLVYAGGDRDGQKVLLDKGRVTFGRKGTNTVHLDDTMVSGYHCEIAKEGGAYVLRDLGSTNGTLLDGDPVTEIALQHGNRIRVGNTRLVFVDPTVAGFEKAMSAVDDLGGEWGLLRAEMDLDRVQRARRSQLVSIVGMFAVVGILGFVFLSNPELLRGGDTTVKLEEIAGNKVADFSFESGGVGWAPASGSPAVRSVETGEGKQGTSFLRVTRDGPKGPPAVVHNTADEITIRPNRVYEVGGHVRTSGGAAASVRVHWLGPDGNPLGIAATPVGDGSAWTRVDTRVRSPSDAGKARIELVNAASGQADFDDVFFVESDASAGIEVTDGAIAIQATPAGSITVLRAGEPLLADLGVVAGAIPADADASSPRGGRAGGTSAASSTIDGGVKVSGQVYDHLTDGMRDFEITVVASEGRYLDFSGTLPEGAGLVGTLRSVYVTEGMSVWTGTGRSFRLSETRIIPNTERALLGNRQPFFLRGKADGQVFGSALFLTAVGHELALGKGSGEFAIRMDVDSEAIQTRRREALTKAQQEEAAKRLGSAVAWYRAASTAFAEGSSQSTEAQQKADAIEKQGRDAVTALTRQVDQALAFRHLGDLESAKAQADALTASFEGHEVAAAAAEQAARVEAELAGLRAAALAVKAQPMLRRAEDYLQQGQKALAQAFLEDVVKRFDGTEAATKAARMLQDLGQGR